MSNYRRAYEENHYIFITVATYKRNKILIKNIEKLKESIKKAKIIYEFEIYAMVILPDHFHTILKPENVREYSKIMGSIKSSFTKSISGEDIDKAISQSRIKRREKGVWQRRFYEHTIRNQEELNSLLDYIHYNPVKYGYVNSVKEWLFSSFHRFVKQGFYDINWGNGDNIKHIEKFAYE